MPELWMPIAEHDDIGNHAPTAGGPAKAIAHITADRTATAAAPLPLVPFETLKSYFRNLGAGDAPHILWDPFVGRFAQFLPADSRALSLVDLPGGTRTNRAGSVVIQIEALFFPYCKWNGGVYHTLADTPCAGWEHLQAWVESWGVPNIWPMGRPNGFVSNRDEKTWETRAGWYGHSQVPENDHTDPGTWPAFISAGGKMTLTAADIEAVAHAVAAYKNVKAVPPETTDAHQRWVNADAQTKTLIEKVDALTAKVDLLVPPAV